MRNLLQLNDWVLLNNESKREILKSFEGYQGHKFKLKSIETFLTNKMEFTTGIFENEECEYIFIPGSKVKLGWSKIDEMDGYILNAIKRELNIAYNSDNADAIGFLADVFSEARECQVAPMLVERNVHKMESINGDLVNYNDVINNIQEQGFSVLTENEWEYLCGAGTRRIFSEHIDERLLEDICNKNKDFYSYYLEQTNQFGVYISCDPYMYEIVDSPCYVKGGDGGGASHAGYYILGVLPISPHYRDIDMIETTSVDGNFEWDVFARRILRIY